MPTDTPLRLQGASNFRDVGGYRTQPLGAFLPHHPAQQGCSAQLYRNKYEELATKGFGALNAF
jgi:hypothetical protein